MVFPLKPIPVAILFSPSALIWPLAGQWRWKEDRTAGTKFIVHLGIHLNAGDLFRVTVYKQWACGECMEQWEITAFRVSIWANFLRQGTSSQDYQQIKPKWSANGATRDEKHKTGRQEIKIEVKKKSLLVAHINVFSSASQFTFLVYDFLINRSEPNSRVTATSIFIYLYIIHKNN